MSLRPRYSLLTLLVLTALVAGGVKLWYGPHHVVEMQSNDWEAEFTYTRDWRGQRVVHGPVVFRQYAGTTLAIFYLRYFRQGFELDWMYYCTVRAESLSKLSPYIFVKAECPLSAQELRALHEVRDAELQRLAKAGVQVVDQAEGSTRSPFAIFPDP